MLFDLNFSSSPDDPCLQLSTFDLNFSIFSPDDPCSAGEGDCEVDADCKGSLRCGYNNCGDNDPTGEDAFDCGLFELD